MSNWIQVLTEQASAHGQEAVAKELGVSKTVVSQLINGKYPGDMARMQKLVEGAYMQQRLLCPILGEIALHTCDKHQGNTSTSNPIRLRLYRACRGGCPHSSLAVKQQFVRPALAVSQYGVGQHGAGQHGQAKRYSSEAVYNRLARQAESDGGGAQQLCQLLKQELQAVETRYNRLLNRLNASDNRIDINDITGTEDDEASTQSVTPEPKI